MSLENRLFKNSVRPLVLGAALVGGSVVSSNDNVNSLQRDIERNVIGVYTDLVNENPELKNSRESAYNILSQVVEQYRGLVEEGSDEEKYLNSIQVRPMATKLQRADDPDIIFADRFEDKSDGYTIVGVPSSLEGTISTGNSTGTVNIPGECLDSLGNSSGVLPTSYEFSGPPGLDNIIAYCSENPFVRQNVGVNYSCEQGSEWNGASCEVPVVEPVYSLVGVGNQEEVLGIGTGEGGPNTIDIEGHCEDNFANQFPIVPETYTVVGPPGTDEVLVKCSQDLDVNKIIEISYDCPEGFTWNSLFQLCNRI